MPSLVTLAEIKEEAAERADMENSNFVDSAELLRYINKSYARLYDLLTTAYPDYFTKTRPYEFTTNTSDRFYRLPSDFYKLRGVDLVASATKNVTLKQFMFEERNRFTEPVIWGFEGAAYIRYRLTGSKLEFSPQKATSSDIQVWYVPTAKKLVNDTDTIDGINGWEEFVILDAAVKMRIKEETDTSDLVRERELLKRELEIIAAQRDLGQTERVSDVRRTSNYSYDGSFY